MNKFERIIYNTVRFSPVLKKHIVKTYQKIFSVFPVKAIQTNYKIIGREGYFFGFHDKCPWSKDNKYLLAHKYPFDLKMPSEYDQIEIGYFTGKNWTDFNSIGETSTWNWQMGSMLQWIGNDDIIFNDFDGKKHISKIVTIAGKLVKQFNKPIAAISSDGKYALSYSFTRLQKAAPAYSYANGEEPFDHENIPQKDGIYLLNLQNGEFRQLFSIYDIANYISNEYSQDSYHYFTHCLFAPNGERFAFFHRWIEPNQRTWTRLFTANIDGSELHQFEFNGVVTHLAWLDDNHLSAYGYKKGIGDHFYLLTDQSNNYEIIGKDIFTSDGHQQFSPNGKYMITDTYPDRLRRQYLVKYDMQINQLTNIAIVKSPSAYIGDVRCDLHPRWDRTGNFICFDSAHTGKRALCTIKLNA